MTTYRLGAQRMTILCRCRESTGHPIQGTESFFRLLCYSIHLRTRHDEHLQSATGFPIGYKCGYIDDTAL